MRYSIALATSTGIFSTLHSYITAVKLNSTAIKKRLRLSEYCNKWNHYAFEHANIDELHLIYLTIGVIQPKFKPELEQKK